MSVLRLGRSLFRSLLKRLPDLKASSRAPVKPGLGNYGEVRESSSTAGVLSTQPLLNNATVLSRHVWNGLTSRAGFLANRQAAQLRRMAASRLLRVCGPRAPMFAFLGFAYAGCNVKPPKDVHEKEQFKNLRQWVQEALGNANIAAQNQEGVEHAALSQLKLKDYELGERLGEGSSNGAVYAAKYNEHDYAVKMLFNFGASSRSSSLHKMFAKESQVLSMEKQQHTSGTGPSFTSLPPHPNIMHVLGSFCDDIPLLPDATHSYPAALPSKYGDGGFSRNRTKFLVMPRYNRTVHEYTASNVTQEPRVATLLLIQLLEGITHLTRYGVAHRDLKTDNLLLDESTSDLCPHLVIADFGCCLADQQWGLTLPFITEEIDRGGNSALMAPEIATAVPGEHAVLDYTKSDAWAAGAISYELFGRRNPFGKNGLNSRSYKDEQLPPLSQAPAGVATVVSLLLKRDPSERISADKALTMLALVLWAPASWLQGKCVSAADVDRWLISQMLVGKRTCPVEDKIMRRFLCRITEEEVLDALELLNVNVEQTNNLATVG